MVVIPKPLDWSWRGTLCGLASASILLLVTACQDPVRSNEPVAPLGSPAFSSGGAGCPAEFVTACCQGASCGSCSQVSGFQLEALGVGDYEIPHSNERFESCQSGMLGAQAAVDNEAAFWLTGSSGTCSFAGAHITSGGGHSSIIVKSGLSDYAKRRALWHEGYSYSNCEHSFMDTCHIEAHDWYYETEEICYGQL